MKTLTLFYDRIELGELFLLGSSEIDLAFAEIWLN